MSTKNKPTLLVLSSSFPRWVNDYDSRFVFELSNRLAKYFNIIVLCPHTKGSKFEEFMENCKVYRFQYAPVKFETLTYEGGISSRLKENKWRYLLIPFFIISQTYFIIKLCNKYHFDYIHAHWIIPQGLSARLSLPFIKKTTKIVLTSHGSDLYTLNDPFTRYMKKSIIKKCSAITVVSSSMKSYLHKNYYRFLPNKVSIIPMGTELTQLFTSQHTHKRLSSTVLFVGRLIEIKGVHLLIESIAIIKKKIPTIKLVIIGSGPEEKKLKSLVKNLHLDDCVTFLAHLPQPELVHYYQQATVSAFPFQMTKSGIQEGFGLVVVEAMGCGCPVIVGDIPAAQDTVTHLETGIIVDASLPQELASKIIFLLSNEKLRNQLAKNAQSNVIKNFAWTATIEKFKALFFQL